MDCAWTEKQWRDTFQGEREEEGPEAVWQRKTDRQREQQTPTDSRRHVCLCKAGENHLCSPPQQRTAGRHCRSECRSQRPLQIGEVLFIHPLSCIRYIVCMSCECILITLLILSLPASAKVHRPGCFQPCGRAPWDQRVALLWPHSCKG